MDDKCKKTYQKSTALRDYFLQLITLCFFMKITGGTADSENDLTQMFVSCIISPYLPYSWWNTFMKYNDQMQTSDFH